MHFINGGKIINEDGCRINISSRYYNGQVDHISIVESSALTGRQHNGHNMYIHILTAVKGG